MRWGVLLTAGVSLALVAPDATAQDPADVTTGLLRQICDLQWVDGACEATGYPEPQYASGTDPSPGEPLALRIGAIHNHSGYSDNDFPDTRPADVFRAAADGHNTADDGGDTGIKLDYLMMSDHSENEKLPITTTAVCIDIGPTSILAPLACSNIEHADHHRKWSATLEQAVEATETSDAGQYTGFTAMRGFEWTNDYYNHLGVYFSRNVVNAKIDGSYLSMELLWGWLREPAERGGGSDALVVFNHPGGWPALTPFDGDLPHNQLLNDTLGGANWNDLAYVPDVDERVVGIEVNGGDDLGWYVKALTNGWHLGPIAAEDEHQLEWSSSDDGKTLMLTRGRSPRDYYFAFQHHRTVRLGADLVDGAPGEPARHPSILFWADAADVQDPAATLLGSTITSGGPHTLHLAATGLPPGSPAVLVSRAGGEPRPLGAAAPDGSLTATAEVTNPAEGEDWWFAVICPPGTEDCGVGEDHSAVTAPIWAQAASAPAPATPGAPDPTTGVGRAGQGRLPATGAAVPAGAVAVLVAALLVGAARRRLHLH